MNLSRLLSIVPLGAIALASSAQACTDPSNMQSYFSYEPPERHGDTVMLRVRVSIAADALVIAKLDGAFSRLSPDGNVRIELPAAPGGGTCLQLGPVDGPVFVIGTLIRTQSGRLTLEALPAPSRPDPPGHYRRVHSDAELDQYIVDPSYLLPALKKAAK
jgi:hypothetical protein